MPTRNVAVSIESTLLDEVDRLVSMRKFPSRSRAFQEAVAEKLERMNQVRLIRESKKLLPADEQEMAEEGMGDAWPEY